MTKDQSIAAVLALAAKWTGQRTSVVDVYNSHTPWARGYKVTYNDALCATYVSALFIKLGWTAIVPPECGAMQLLRNMAALDRYTARADHSPAPGDLIFFDWHGDGWCDHVGIVIAVRSSGVTYSHIPSCGVTVATVDRLDKSIMGYGSPDYAAVSDSDQPDPEPEPETETEIRPGSLARIRPGASWYDGGAIPDFVVARAWSVVQVNGDRAVLGTDEEHRYNIQSPIHTADLTPAAAPVVTAPEQVTFWATLDKTTFDWLKGSGKTLQQILEEVRHG